MIADTLTNAGKYYDLHKNFALAFEYLKTHDLLALEIGKFEIGDGVLAIVSDKDGVSTETADSKCEAHNKNIDIQLCIRGNETLGWKPRNDCKDPKGEYSDEKDVIFYNDKPDMYFGLKAGQFAIFYPDDMHTAMIGEGLIKKLVVKVRI